MSRASKPGKGLPPPPPPPPPYHQQDPIPSPGGAGNTSGPSLEHQIALPEQAPERFVVKMAGIEDTELRRREVHITTMGNAPVEDWETRKPKAFEFMNATWGEAENIFNGSRETIEQKMTQEGKEFSESAGKVMVFVNLLMQKVLNAKCISCQMPTNKGPKRRFLPIEITEHPAGYVNIVRMLASEMKASPELDSVSFLREIHREIVKDLDEDCLEERDRTIRVLTAADWCDPRLVLKPNVLKGVVGLCGKSYIEYRQATQMQENANLFDQVGHVESQLQPADQDFSAFINSIDFSFDL